MKRPDVAEGESTAQALELALRLEAIGAMMALGHIDEIFKNMERAETIAAQLNDQLARASVSNQTALFLWMRGQFSQSLQHASRGLDAARLAQRRHMMMGAHQTRLMNFHALGQYTEAAEEARIVLADYGPELAEHSVPPGWAAIPIISVYSFYASTLWRLGDRKGGHETCALAYEILSNVNHPYSRVLIDTVQGQIWIEEEELDKAEALLRAAVQQCLTYNVPTTLAMCTGVLGSALARNGKASEAATLLERGFADRIYDAAGTYGRTFMRIGLGVAYRNLERLEDAIRVGRKAVDASRRRIRTQDGSPFRVSRDAAHCRRCARCGRLLHADLRVGTSFANALLQEARGGSPGTSPRRSVPSMKIPTPKPDTLPPGLRRFLYGLFCWLNRHIIVLRRLGALLRHFPFVGGWFGVAARASAVRAVMTRPQSFSNSAHAPNLASGEYLIGMDPAPPMMPTRFARRSGWRHWRRRCRPAPIRKPSDLLQILQNRGTEPFDLIEDYLMWIVFRAMDPLFGSATDRVAAGAHGNVKDPGLQRQYLMEIRYVAGQLLAGSSATLRVQRRAELCADALRARIAGVSNDIRQAWKVPASPNH